MKLPEGVETSHNPLKDLFKSYDIDSAVLVDDNAARMIRQETWITLRELLEEKDPDTFSAIAKLLEDHEIALSDDLPPVDLHEQLLTLIENGREEGRNLVARARFGEAELDTLYRFLEDLGIEVTACSSPEAAPCDKRLYFIDYNIGDPPGSEGMRAQGFLAKLMESHLSSKTCPAVMMMSRQEPGIRQWTAIANNSHVVRFCFRYRDKQELVESESHFVFHISELFDTYPLGQQYVGHVESVRSSLRVVAEEVANELLRLTPADFSTFASTRMEGNSGTSVRHLRFLFSSLLEQALCSSNAVSATFTDFVSSLLSRPAVVSSDSLALHELQGRILYDRTESTLNEPISFGDIIIEHTSSLGGIIVEQLPSERFFLVVTPECDLEQDKAISVLAIEGLFVTKKNAGDSLEYTALVNFDNSQMGWIEWNLRRIHTFDFKRLTQSLKDSHSSKRKWGSLRFQFAERIQNRLASDLLEVGTEEFMEGLSEVDLTVFSSHTATEPCGLLSLCLMRVERDEKKGEMSLGEEVGPLLANLDAFGLTVNQVLAFRRMTKRSDFISELKKLKLFLFDRGGRSMALVRVTGGDHSAWKNRPEAWKDATAVNK